LFAQSGAADCQTLDKIYKPKMAQNLTNQEFLNSVIGFYRRVRCNESEVYFDASVALHKIAPTAESAAGNGAMSYKKGDFAKAIAFYDEATRLTDDKSLKADYQYTIAQIYYKDLNNYPRSREYARNSLEFNPNNGSAYILIGIMYAKSKGIYDDPVLAKTIYWVAVDKFIKAKQVDPSVTKDANELINTYTPHFPSKEDIFFQPELKVGSSFTVGGWIQETTICR
jgi:tetratricopeptide (TPR) repeat protein